MEMNMNKKLEKVYNRFYSARLNSYMKKEVLMDVYAKAMYDYCKAHGCPIKYSDILSFLDEKVVSRSPEDKEAA